MFFCAELLRACADGEHVPGAARSDEFAPDVASIHLVLREIVLAGAGSPTTRG